MHENAKYTVRLSEDIKPYEPEREFTDKRAAKDSVADWQCIFADIAYGTHYLIYAKFLGHKNEETGGFSVKKIQLYLQNYTGAVTVGLTDRLDLLPPIKYRANMKDPDNDPIRFPRRRKYPMIVYLQGLNNTTFMEYDEEFEIANGDIMETKPEYVPVENKYSSIFGTEDDLKKSLFVDEMYMERDGDDVFIHSQGIKNLFDLEIEGQALTLAGETRAPRAPQGRPHPCKPRNSIFTV